MVASANTKDNGELLAELDAAHAAVTSAQRRLLEIVARCDSEEVWGSDGARDLPQWLSWRLGISHWAGRRWIQTAHALGNLPRLSSALETGALCLDKVLELCRFAQKDTEKRLISWGQKVTAATIRRRADLENAPKKEDVVEADRTRFLRYWFYDDDRRFGLEGSFPADTAAVVAKALDRLAGRLPDIVDDDHPMSFEDSLDARRADALVALASKEIAEDSDPDRATVVVHADLDALLGDHRGCEIEGGPIVHPETARRLSCDARLEVVLHDPDGCAVGIGRASRTPSPWLVRQLRHRDRTCRFPGCELKRFLHAHHIIHWIRGGQTNLENLLLTCTFHHKLLHEYGWRVELGKDGTATWFRPNGRRMEAPRSPPRDRAA